MPTLKVEYIWVLAAAIYLLSGVFLVTGARVRNEIAEEVADVTTKRFPLWKIVVYWVICLAVTALFWPLLLPSWFAKKRTLWDEVQENPLFQQQKQIYDLMSLMCEGGCETDEMPYGHGEFGYEPTNPIPTKTIFGSKRYLARLRTQDGANVVYERRGSTTSNVTPHPIDIYEISLPNGTRLATLYLSPYQKKNSDKAPKELVLLKNIVV